MFADLLFRLENRGKPPQKMDRLSFFKLCVLHVVALPLVLKVRETYKSDPLVSGGPPVL